MSAGAKLKGSAVATFLGGDRRRRARKRVARTLTRRTPVIEFYWRADDAYSHVVAQLLKRLAPTLRGVSIKVIVVPTAAADVDPEPALRAEHAARDCGALAQFYEVRFPSLWKLPSADRVRRADAVVMKERPALESLDAAIEIGDAIYRDAPEILAEVVQRLGAAPGAGVRPALEAAYARLRKKGHYQSATLEFEGEWYDGPHRVNVLQRRLIEEGLAEPAPLVLARRGMPALAREPDAELEMWFSFRSPYSYLAIAQVAPWVDRGVKVRFRPVLPMVMRGLAVPTQKKLYLVRDAHREAQRLGIPFGHLCDPVGAGAERCLAVCAAIGDQSRMFAFANSAAAGIWSEALDAADDADLVVMAERAGVSRAEVMEAVADLDRGRALAETNREALIDDAALWGVPSFRVGSLVTWGQDRLPLVAHVLGFDIDADKT